MMANAGSPLAAAAGVVASPLPTSTAFPSSSVALAAFVCDGVITDALRKKCSYQDGRLESDVAVREGSGRRGEGSSCAARTSKQESARQQLVEVGGLRICRLGLLPLPRIVGGCPADRVLEHLLAGWPAGLLPS
nr:uncharacterized protein LOC129386829 [Dermacentor andersoni]